MAHLVVTVGLLLVEPSARGKHHSFGHNLTEQTLTPPLCEWL
jgi:hypothetical protein